MKSVRLILFTLILGTQSLFAQTDTTIYEIVDTMPKFPGGEEAMMHYLAENINYPSTAMDAGISGTVYAQFVVELDGGITGIEILQGIGGGCDAEVIRCIALMPTWTAGVYKDKKVRVSTTLPVVFEVHEIIDTTKWIGDTLVTDTTTLTKMAEYPGGEDAMLMYLGKNVNYPIQAMEAGVTGVVSVEFIVQKDGSLSDVRLLKRIGGGCDEEVVKVIKSMPKWSPSQIDGKNVATYYKLPVAFESEDSLRPRRNTERIKKKKK